MAHSFWDERYDRPEYIFGTAPNEFLAAQRERFTAGERVLAVADGEGRNGVWLAQQGLTVHAVDASPVALAKARTLAAERGATVTFEEADLLTWAWPIAAFNWVVGIFVQFAPPEGQDLLIRHMQQATIPGGHVLLQGYTRRQLTFRTGGPGNIEQLWTEDRLERWFADWDIIHLRAHDTFLNEGTHHHGPSAVIDLIARRPA